MNREHAIMAHQRDASDELIDLGTESTAIELGPHGFRWCGNRTRTIGQFLAALPVTTTLNFLTVRLESRLYYRRTPESSISSIIEPLCRCIANLRRHNEHHPLQTLKFWRGGRSSNDVESRMSDVIERFLIAAKRFGIHRLILSGGRYPIQIVVELCHDNKNLKILEMDGVTILAGGAAISCPPDNGQPIVLTLDTLILRSMTFANSLAATSFSIFLAQANVSALHVGDSFDAEFSVMPRSAWARAPPTPARIYDDPEEAELTRRILREFKMPSVEHLEMEKGCLFENFQAALDAGTTSLIELVVNIDCGKDDATARLESLTSMILRAVRLKNLTIQNYSISQRHISPPHQFFHALEACGTVTHITVNDPGLQRQLQEIANRNRELAGFVASPGTYPTDKLLNLMRQCDNCPTGLYMLARHLPQVFSFQKGDSLFPPTELIPKQNLRKRRNISYKE